MGNKCVRCVFRQTDDEDDAEDALLDDILNLNGGAGAGGVLLHGGPGEPGGGPGRMQRGGRELPPPYQVGIRVYMYV